MDPLVSPTPADQHDLLIKAADEKITNTRDQIAKADEQIARVHEELSRLESVARRHAAGSRPPANPPRLVAPTRGRLVMRGLVSLLLAAFICLGAIAWRSPYGETARSVIGQSIPQLAQASLPSQKEPALSSQPTSSSVQTTAGQQASQQEPSAQPAQPNGAKGTEVSPELAETLQTMARSLANLAQAVEQLRTSQEQMASDTAKAMQQLKDNQEQMTGILAKLSEQSLQARTPAAAQRPTPPATRKPVATSALSQATRQQAPAQLRAGDPRTTSTVRTPMQLR
jgi:hypothetical protein